MKGAFVVVLLVFLVGCGGQQEPRIAAAQDLAVKRMATSLLKHNQLHGLEQGAYKAAKEGQKDALFSQSIKEAKASAEADPNITKSQLADEILRRVEKRDQNSAAIQMQVALMRQAQTEANKPAADAAEMLGIVLQFEQTEGFSYTELINTLAPLVPSPLPIPGK